MFKRHLDKPMDIIMLQNIRKLLVYVNLKLLEYGIISGTKITKPDDHRVLNDRFYPKYF